MAFNISQENTKFDCNLTTISFNNGCLILSQHFFNIRFWYFLAFDSCESQEYEILGSALVPIIGDMTLAPTYFM